MPQNIIYNYLSSSENYHYLEPKTDLESSRYYLLPLRQKSEGIQLSSGNELSLQNHHVSVYEKTCLDNFYLSPYHYTAYYSSRNKTYKLHVYFNLDGTLSSSAELKEKNKENYNKVDLLPEDHDVFISLAINNSRELIRRLFNEVTALKKSLYENLKNSKDINEKLRIIEQLIQYDPKNKTHLNHIKKQIVIKASLETKRQNEQVLVANNDAKEHRNNNPQNVELESNAHLQERISGNRKREEIIQFQRELDEFFKNEEVLRDIISKGLDESNADTFTSIFYKLNEYYILFENLRLEDSYEEKLEELYSFCDDNIKGIVLRLLLSGKFSLAEKFSNYYEEIFDDIFNLALTTDNSDLLEHILKYCPRDINNILTSDKLGSQNPLVYSYNNKKINSIYVLLQHKASILIAADDGLPLAFHLLKDFSCIYYSFIYKNFEGVKFFKAFLNLIDIYNKNNKELENSKLSDSIEQIKRMISSDIAIVNNLRSIFPRNYNQVLNKFYGLSFELLLGLDSNLRKKILKVPRFFTLSDRMELAVTKFFEVQSNNIEFIKVILNFVEATTKVISQTNKTIEIDGDLGVYNFIFPIELTISCLKSVSNEIALENIIKFEIFKKIVFAHHENQTKNCVKDEDFINSMNTCLDATRKLIGEEPESYLESFMKDFESGKKHLKLK